MTSTFNWTSKSDARNRLTAKYEPVQPLLLFEFLNAVNATSLYDVGANVGYYSILLSQVASLKKIVAFEASSETFEHLLDNVALNGLTGKISCIKKAVSSSTGTLQFQTEGELSGINSVLGTSLHSKDIYSSIEEVEACTIDDVADHRDEILGFKIDVEGHELEVLKGAKRTLETNRCVLQIESYSRQAEVLTHYLSGLGYKRVFNAKEDQYFSNISALLDPVNTLKLVEAALANVIESSLGRWPVLSDIPTTTVTVEQTRDTVTATCHATGYGDAVKLEYAFYVDADGKRLITRWYEPTACVTFNVPAGDNVKALSIKGFVRDATRPNRVLSGKPKSVQMG